MMLTGVIKRGEGPGPGWVARCDAIGAITQGKSRKHAAERLADCIDLIVDREGFRSRVTEIGSTDEDSHTVLVDSDQLDVLAAEVLKVQRRRHKLTLADVQKRLGASSANAYATYERGERQPSLGKFRELLAAVAPELVLAVIAGPVVVPPAPRPRGRKRDAA